MKLTRKEAMYCERVQQVVRVLRDVKEDGRLFSLRYWGAADPDSIQEMINEGYIPEGSCGTVACAMGWAGLDPWFNRRGFRIYMEPPKDEDAISHFYPTLETRGHRRARFSDFDAVLEFLNISSDDGYHLFVQNRYDDDYTIDDVMARINDYIADTYGEEHRFPVEVVA